MKRMQLIAAALCLIMITTVGAGVVAAQQENPNLRRAGESSIYFYDVAPTGTHGSGKLQIDVKQHTFVFNGKDFEPSVQIALQAKAGSSDLKVFATGKATPSGNLHIAGEWKADAAPDDVVGATIYMGTLQRATSYYPDYTLVYTDYAGQKFTIYLPPNTITGGTLPLEIATPVALDYVYNIVSGPTFTVKFVYQGVTYSADWATTTHAPYLSCNPKYNVYADFINSQIFGHVSLNYWDGSKYVSKDAAGVQVDCDVRTSIAGVVSWEDLFEKTTNSEGKFCKGIPSFSPPDYRLYLSLSGYPTITEFAEWSLTPGVC